MTVKLRIMVVQSVDELIKAMDKEREVRLVIARTTDMTNEMANRHQMSATVRAAGGRLVTGALLLASELKNGKGVTVQINGGGLVGDLVAVAEPEGTARLFIENPGADLPSKCPGKLDVGGLVGTDGVVRVIKDMGLKQPFIGSVPLQSGEIADDIAYYLLLSEQIPSIVALGVLVDKDLSVLASGGLLIQALPGASDDKLAWIEERVNRMGTLSSLVKDHELKSILNMIMGEDGFDVLERLPLTFSCRCSQEKVEAIIRTLPDEEVKLSLQELGMIEVKCNFCNDTYAFNESEIDAIRCNS